MDEQKWAFLRQRYAFSSWPQDNNVAAPLIQLATFTPPRLAGWKLLRSNRATLPDGVATMFCLWQREGQHPTLVAVDLFERASRADAGLQMLALFGEFQSPLVTRKDPPPVGELAFAPPGQTTLLFQRANLAVLLRNVGAEPFDVWPLAKELDGRLTQGVGT